MTISKQLFLLNHKRTHRIQTCMLVEFRITYFPSFFSLVKMNKVTILFLMALQYRDFTHLQYYPISSSFSSSSPPAPRLLFYQPPFLFSHSFLSSPLSWGQRVIQRALPLRPGWCMACGNNVSAGLLFCLLYIWQAWVSVRLGSYLIRPNAGLKQS